LSHRLTTIRSMVCLENVTVRVSHRPPSRKKAVRKDLRRPRFSFFRFNCQTANPKLRQAQDNTPKAQSKRRFLAPTSQSRGSSLPFRRRSDARPLQSRRSDAVDAWDIRRARSAVNTNLTLRSWQQRWKSESVTIKGAASAISPTQVSGWCSSESDGEKNKKLRCGGECDHQIGSIYLEDESHLILRPGSNCVAIRL
jgi:hypothetical protein